MKFKLYYIFLSLFLFSFYGCQEIDIESDKRITVSGKLVDAKGNSIANIPINTHVGGYILGKGTTDENGAFFFTSLQSSSNDFVISINPKKQGFNEFNLEEINYSSADIINFDEGDFINVDLYEFGEIVLPQTALLDFEIRKTSTEDVELNWSLSLFQSNCHYAYKNSIEKISINCHKEYGISNIQDNQSPNFSQTFTSLKDRSIEFTYQIGNTPFQTINIPITDQTNTYVFEY